jgi:hypothetical protein
MNQNREEPDLYGNRIFEFLNLPDFRNIDCPLCRLYISEIGILNAPERDLKIFSRHVALDHGFSNTETTLIENFS